MASARDNAEFTKSLLPAYPLDEAIEWIRKNLEPEDVFPDEKLREWAKVDFSDNEEVYIESEATHGNG